MPRLRIIATSDLHAHAQPYDYIADRPDPTRGLAAAAVLIEEARREALAEGAACLFVDNGDLLQGAAIGDLCSAEGVPAGERHPMIEALACLDCAAATPGNHEFNYGLDFMRRAYGAAPFPVVCANVLHADGRPLFPPFAILDVDLPAGGGRVRVGVTGAMPPQILMWDKALIGGLLMAHDIVEALARTVPAMRAAGADIVLVLCHSGIAEGPREGGEENAALLVAESVPGIDALVAGHLHRVFPGGRDFAGIAGVDVAAGRLAGVPAVMPGFHGSHVGIIDLDLARADGGWRVDGAAAASRATARLPRMLPPAAQRVIAATADAHARTLVHARKPVGEALRPIDTFFTVLGDDADLALLAAAQEDFVRAALLGTPYADLPLLSSAAPFMAGGRAGAGAYAEIAAGPLALRDLAALYPYPNAVCAVRITGAEIRLWLERAAGIYRRIDPNAAEPQFLVDGRFPSYHFDMIRGLAYTIDPTQPSRFDREGDLLHPGATRIRDLTHRGRPVADADVFILATNTYRAGGGGRFCGGKLDAVYTSTTLVREALQAFVAATSPLVLEERLAWRLALPADGEFLFATCPRALGREPAGWRLEDRGLDEDGYRVYRVPGAAPRRAAAP